MEPKTVHRVLVSRRVPVPSKTVSGLLGVLEQVLSAKNKPTRILYKRGEDLYVEALELTDRRPEDGGFVTPYQMVRQHCDLTVTDLQYLPAKEPLHTFCDQVVEVRKSAPLFTAVVVPARETLTRWLPVDVSLVFGVPVLVDPEAPDNSVIFCASSVGDLVADFEAAVMLRLGSS